MAFRKLFAKEFRSVFPVFGMYMAVLTLWDFFVLYKSGDWGPGIASAAALAAPMVLVSFLAIGIGYYQLHTEWRTNSIYLLLSLPVRGWKVLSAKLAAVLSSLLLSLAWTGISYGIILLGEEWGALFGDEQQKALPALVNVTLHSLWMYVLSIVFALAVVHFAYLLGQLVSRFKWVVMTGAGFAIVWLALRAGPFLSDLLWWMPDIVFGDAGVGAIYLHSGPFLVLLLFSAGLIALNGYIFEREVEV